MFLCLIGIYPQKFTAYAKIQECQEEIRSVVQQLVKSVEVDGPNEVILVEGGLIILLRVCNFWWHDLLR